MRWKEWTKKTRRGPVSGLVSTPGYRDITGSKLEDLTMNYPYSKMCQADGKHVSTKRHSCLTYKISIKNNIIIIIIIRDTGSYPNPVSKTKGLLPYFKIRFLWRRQNLKNANLRRSNLNFWAKSLLVKLMHRS